ncbi:MAG: hypothetical protein M0P43_08390 [Arcobacteraceae bacterium]|nr:hypothetical protein [Arcobacteraceae bacterium]
MIQFIVGIPSSGKTYYGIFNICINFSKDLKDNKKFKSYKLSTTKYKSCLTNINELKLDRFDNVKYFSFEDFKQDLILLYSAYQNGYTDSQLEDLIKEKDFFNTLIVVDECHNYLNKDDEVLIWWLSYHRHFHQDIILITQDLPLVNKKYKSFTEFYYKAIPSSRKIFNFNMIYHQYTGHQFFKSQKAQTKKLPIIKEIFDLYSSGENNKQKSLVLYYLIISAFIFFVVFIVFYLYVNRFDANSPSVASENISIKQDLNVSQLDDSKNFKLPSTNYTNVYVMNCVNNVCEINSNFYEIDFISEIFTKYYKPVIIAQIDTKVYLMFDDDFELFNKKGSINENKNNTNLDFTSNLFKGSNQ